MRRTTVFKVNPVKIIIALSILCLLTACTAQSNKTDDILTQKRIGNEKIPITISTKYSVYLEEFEKLAEKEYPNLDLILVGNYTANYSDEYAEQLEHDDLADIVVTWPLDQAAQKCEDRLIDLSGMEFSSRYNLSMLNSIAKDGELYYLPGPTQVRGILFNKTLFEENGWSVPNDFDSFISLCQEIEASGMRSLQLSFWNKEVLRHTFMGFGYTESFSTPDIAEAINQYNQGKGSLSDFALPAFQSFQRLMDAGILRTEDLDVRYPIREQMLYGRKCAMVNEGMDLLPAARQAGNTDEFAVMPLYCPGNGSWGQLIPTQYIGLNKNLTKPGNEEKYDLALELMDFISTQKGQLALANGNTSMISSLIDSPTPDAPELKYMKDVIQEGRCVVFPSLDNAAEALSEGLAGILTGKLNQEQVIKMVDKENKKPTESVKSPVIGSATETFSIIETGNYVTDVLRAKANADFALFLDNGKDGRFNARGISAKFYEGDILESDVIARVLPVLQHGEAGHLNIATMTGEDLINALEYGLDDGNWFYYASGLRMKYDPLAVPGQGIKEITDENGESIQLDKQYTVAIMEGSVDGEYITSLETTDLLVKDLVINDILKKGTITPSKDGRFQF